MDFTNTTYTKTIAKKANKKTAQKGGRNKKIYKIIRLKIYPQSGPHDNVNIANIAVVDTAAIVDIIDIITIIILKLIILMLIIITKHLIHF